MIRETFPVGPLQCNCTILADETSRQALVIDPGDEIPRILLLLAKHALTVKQILVTHAHIDHVAGAQQLKQITGAPVLYNQRDLPLIAMIADQAEWLGMPTPEVAPPDADLADRLQIHITGLTGEILHTPGHTQGSVCLHLPDHALLLAGDTLTLLQSIHNRLLTLPDQTLVIPGHGPSTSIGQERERNPFLQLP